MNQRPRPFASLVGVAAGCSIAWGIYHLMLIGSCSSPPSDGLPVCPPGSESYFFAVFLGVLVAMGSIVAGGSWLSFCAIFAGIGVGALRAAGPTGQGWFVWFGLGFLGAPVLFAAGLVWTGVRRLRALHLVRDGVQGTGTLLSLADTGITVNGNPRVRMTFRVELSDGSAPYEAAKTATVPRVHIPRVGDRYPVWVDPADHGKWVLVTGDGGGAPTQPNLRNLVELAKHGAKPAVPPPTSAGVVAELSRLNEERLAGKIGPEEFARRTDELLQGT